MNMVRIPDELRRFVIARANGFCEYCWIDMEIRVDMAIDHIKPVSEDGETTADNLCLACFSCNNHKHDHSTGIEPLTQTKIALYNPRTQQWREHFQWINDFTEIVGRTSTGRATVNRLKMNDVRLIAARRRWRRAGWHPPTA